MIPLPAARDPQPVVRRSADRGRLRNGWLDARFSFSFAGWRDPAWDRFGALRALNEDVIRPGTGFGPHPHADLEIFVLPLAGAVEHRDSLGTHAVVRPGEMQRMTAGSGIVHSQMNPSPTETDHHLQIWLEPRTRGLPPAVEQRRFDPAGRRGRWQLLVSPDARDGSLGVHQDAEVLIAAPVPGAELAWAPPPGRSLYLHVVSGTVAVAGAGDRWTLAAGDALAMQAAAPLRLAAAAEGAEVLLFDLPPAA
ncbi:MAG TPA: pirin family protein [Azospirillaceae bacterium]|nr:pirin family protein [Azospirillaceae bacterium]